MDSGSFGGCARPRGPAASRNAAHDARSGSATGDGSPLARRRGRRRRRSSPECWLLPATRGRNGGAHSHLRGRRGSQGRGHRGSCGRPGSGRPSSAAPSGPAGRLQASTIDARRGLGVVRHAGWTAPKTKRLLLRSPEPAGPAAAGRQDGRRFGPVGKRVQLLLEFVTVAPWLDRFRAADGMEVRVRDVEGAASVHVLDPGHADRVHRCGSTR